MMRNIANNINQIAKNSNIFKTLLSSNKLLTKLQELEKAVIDFIHNPNQTKEDIKTK
ncbi:MAG: hypothetical protein U9N59_01600 [Campylobacterota bacterium]|nr:hypothetical protein [Campylobacterota bacterium]